MSAQRLWAAGSPFKDPPIPASRLPLENTPFLCPSSRSVLTPLSLFNQFLCSDSQPFCFSPSSRGRTRPLAALEFKAGWWQQLQTQKRVGPSKDHALAGCWASSSFPHPVWAHGEQDAGLGQLAGGTVQGDFLLSLKSSPDGKYRHRAGPDTSHTATEVTLPWSDSRTYVLNHCSVLDNIMTTSYM